VTLTTLGYGNVVINEQWRILAALKAANEIIIPVWTTALVVALLQHVRPHDNGS